MKISVKYFASMRDTMGKANESVDITDNSNVAELWKSVTSSAMPENTLIAVNMEYTNSEHVLNDGDEVAFFPPVTGG